MATTLSTSILSRSAIPQASRIVALNAATGDSYWGVTVYSTGFALGEV